MIKDLIIVRKDLMDVKEEVKLIKKLREETGVGIMTCKKILEHTEFNYDEATHILKTEEWWKPHPM